VVAGEPDEVLLRSAAALRRMGARLTRYDAGALTLEARLACWGLAFTVHVAAGQGGDGVSRLAATAAGEGPGPLGFWAGRRLLRRFRATLARTDLPPLARAT
jgi:hypothetical protein